MFFSEKQPAVVMLYWIGRLQALDMEAVLVLCALNIEVFMPGNANIVLITYQ